MKNRKLVAWLCLSIMSQAHAQESSNTVSLRTGCIVALLATATTTAWNYLTESTDTKSIAKKSRLKKCLDSMYHNFLYIGLPLATVVTGLSCIANTHTKKPTHQFFKGLEQNILKLLPGMVVQTDDQHNVELKGVEESVNAFTERYGSPIKTATKTVVVHTANGIVYVAACIAGILKDSIAEVRKQKSVV